MNRGSDSSHTPAAPQPAVPGATYTCPMHPQIRQAGPGSCPICGMALEPLVPTAQQPDDSELRTVRRKFWISAILALSVMLVPLRAVQLLLALPVVTWAAADYYRRGWAGVINRSPNMYTLIGLGVLISYVY